MEYTGLKPSFIKRAPLAWYASHRHNAQGEDEPYSYSYLFAYQLEIPPSVNTITLPDNPKIRVLAATAVQTASSVNPTQPLCDILPGGQATLRRLSKFFEFPLMVFYNMRCSTRRVYSFCRYVPEPGPDQTAQEPLRLLLSGCSRNIGWFISCMTNVKRQFTFVDQ